MKQAKEDFNQEGKENTRLEKYRTAINDARHIFNTYKVVHPDEAWECIRRIIFDKHLK